VVSAPDVTAGIELPGKVRSAQPVDLAFKGVGGRLVELPIAEREGEEVGKGELLAQIDPTGFESALRGAENKLGDAYSVVDLARAENERLERMKGINPDLVSGSMLERTRERLKEAEAQLKSIEAQVVEAESRLEHSSLRAPFNSVIVRSLVDNHQDVQAGEPIVSLQDATHLEVLIDAPATMMAAAQSLGPNSISVLARFPSAPGKQFSLVVKEAARTADPATETHQLVLEMPKPKALDLPPGAMGTVTLSGKEPGIGRSRILIPAIAVLTDPDGKSYVWLVNPADLRVHRRDIQIGRLAGSDKIQVLGGLSGEERIVVAGVMQLTEGRQVRLWEDQQAGKEP
jgi:RND family efflux transporter MFP subunit